MNLTICKISFTFTCKFIKKDSFIVITDYPYYKRVYRWICQSLYASPHKKKIKPSNNICISDSLNISLTEHECRIQIRIRKVHLQKQFNSDDHFIPFGDCRTSGPKKDSLGNLLKNLFSGQNHMLYLTSLGIDFLEPGGGNPFAPYKFL